MSDLRGSGLDAIARDLASGAISRRAALRRFGGVAVAAMLPGALFADSALARCPKDRRCDGRCCPKHGHCKKGRCKCDRGFTKCGKKCRNLETDERNCGSCGHECQAGETCRNGHCKPPAPGQVCGNNVIEGNETCDGTDLGGADCVSLGFVSGTLACSPDCMSFDTSGCVAPCASPGDCPDPGTCAVATCEGGVCGSAPDPSIGGACQCDCGPGHATVPGTIICDQTNGFSCQCGPCCGASGQPCCDGTTCESGLTCSSGTCIECTVNTDCPGATADSTCSEVVCVSGKCQSRTTAGDVCGVTGSGCPANFLKDLCCQNGTCSQACGVCTQ